MGQDGGCLIGIWGPMNLQPRWLFLVAYAYVDSRAPWSSCLALGSALMDTWSAPGWGLWWMLDETLHTSTLEKMIMNYGGTWESNPGPRDYKPRFQPLNHLCASVSEIEKKYNIKNTRYMLKNKMKGAWFEWTTPCLPRPSSSSFSCKIENT